MQTSASRQVSPNNTDTSSRAPENSNGARECQMKLDEFSKGSGTYRELTLVFPSTGTEYPKIPRSHIYASSMTFAPIRKKRTECDLLWEEKKSPLTDQYPPQHTISPPQNCIGTASSRPQAPSTSWLMSKTFNSST